MSWAVIIPTNRPDKFVEFLEAWDYLFERHNVHLIVVQDLAKTDKKIAKATKGRNYKVTLLNWSHLPTKHIPTRTDMIRSYGFYYAYTNTAKQYFLTLDDDVEPAGDVLKEYAGVFKEGAVLSDYLDVGTLTTSGLQMRGFPYKDREKVDVGVQYGGWSGVLDYDAATQLATPKNYEFFLGIIMPVPRGVPTTCCIMNAAWKREYTPIMWQLPLFDGRYNRVGDIWSGLFIKKVLDSQGAAMVINGEAKVVHNRASDPYNSLKKEAPSVWLNDHLWENLADGDYKTITDSAYNFFKQHDPEYAEHFKKARDEWLALFE